MNNKTFTTRLLIGSNLFFMAFIAFMMLSGFNNQTGKERFTEIDVERINIIGTNKKPVLVISNKDLMPGPTMNGKAYPRSVIDGRDLMHGLLFFNEEGDEVGSLIYAGIKIDSTRYGAVGHLSMDQWHQNQVLALDYNDRSGNRYAGMRVWDRPANATFDKMLDLMQQIKEAEGNKVKSDSLTKLWIAARERGENGAERLFIGSRNEEAQIQLKDKKGNTRARLLVDNATGNAKLEFLNEKGIVTSSFPK